jgi:hypothetical protein
MIFASDLARVLSFYAIFGIGMYFLMRVKEHSRFVSFFTSFSAMFSMGVIIWVMIGHNTKPIVFSMFPWIFIMLEKLRLKFSLLLSALLVFLVHFMVSGLHMQMIFYGIVAFGLYLVFELVNRVIRKDQPLSVVRVAIILALAGGLSYMMSADRFLSTTEYTPYSTRGSAPIVQEKKAQDASGGNTYDYATMWSFSPQEVVTFVIPGYFGFGQNEYQGALTNNNPIKMNTYWGQKEFEDAPPYMGIIIFVFAIVGFIAYRRDVFVQFLAVLGLFGLILSFGKNFSLLYDLFYYFVPSFNKFRAPSMSLVLVQFVMPILAGYGLTEMIRWRNNISQENKKKLNFLFIAGGSFLLLGVLFNVMFKTAYLDSVAKSNLGKLFLTNYGDAALEDISGFIWSNMMGDWLIAAFTLLIALALVYSYMKQKMGHTAFYIGIFLIVAVDLWRIGYRPMDYADKTASWQKENFRQTDLIDYLKQDKSVYRISDFASKSPNLPAYYFLENVGGYHSAKVRVFQDILDVVEGGSTSQIQSPLLWNMLNVKYLIVGREIGGAQPAFRSQQTGQLVYVNPGYLQRAYFVDTLKISKGLDILKAMKNQEFNPANVAFMEKDPGFKIDIADSTTKVQFLGKENEYLKLKATASGNNLLFLSEIYYPPGWKAYIDGKETTIFKTNYAFRSVLVPKGEHIVEFKFRSEKFELGRSLSLSANILTVLLVAIGLFFERKNIFKKRTEE